MATIGRYLQNSRNRVKNSPKLPSSMPRSTQVGVNMCQLEGRKSRERLVTMITKRSNHMPTFTHMATSMITHRLVRSRLDQNNWGASTLQETIVQ